MSSFSELIRELNAIGCEQSSAAELMMAAHNVHGAAQASLSKIFPEGDRSIDEVAILFASGSSLLEFIYHSVQLPGVTLFNTAEDVLVTSPIASTYTAFYWFLSTQYGFRIECMQATTGSPLHDNCLRAIGRVTAVPGVLVHASFKCRDEEDYGIVVHQLRSSEYEAAQFCDGEYGRFSYWQSISQVPTSSGDLVYLKPRVNLRDN